ncbi:hypothetical protein L2E82_21155 [Cichorium intybus]|uniref:Uncharacterized protein n=1 Tax=Cichorium intybus TaxID=13427 RepID=A0ACB9DVM7_CICIN|nr:hypothetical protein L2E82_21155 [Cichorium intybus]
MKAFTFSRIFSNGQKKELGREEEKLLFVVKKAVCMNFFPHDGFDERQKEGGLVWVGWGGIERRIAVRKNFVHDL